MRTQPQSIILRLAALALAGLLTAGCKMKSAEEPAAAKPTSETAPTSVSLTPEALKTAGIQTAAAELRPAARTVRATGEILFNPKRVAHVTARTAGRIEKLFAYAGDRVQAGQLLISFYSKDFLSLQAELLQALERSKREGLDDAERRSAQSLLDSVQNRIRVLDIGEDELAAIEKSGRIITLLPVRAPIGGSVIESLVNAGDYMDAGVDLFRLADLSTVWVDLHIFERDLAAVRPGCDASIRAAAFPGRTYTGRIFQLGSVLDEKTRTIAGRVDLANPAGDLRPGMYVDAEIHAAAEEKALLVPAAALQDFLNKKVVFLRTGENVFALREVETGAAFGAFVEVRAGLKEGDVVATTGSFFLKSELLKKTLGEDLP
jgi:Cu(I)/Ag(I) efflux system membrane fusion protein